MTTELVPMEFLNRIKMKLLANYINYTVSLYSYSFNDIPSFAPVTRLTVEIVVRKEDEK